MPPPKTTPTTPPTTTTSGQILQEALQSPAASNIDRLVTLPAQQTSEGGSMLARAAVLTHKLACSFNEGGGGNIWVSTRAPTGFTHLDV